MISLEEDHRVSRGVVTPPSAARLPDSRLARGFASPPRDGFALIEKESSLCEHLGAREVPSKGRFEAERR